MLFTQTLNQNADFQRLYRHGAFCSLGIALLYVMPNDLPCNRLGITAGKKVGNAVHRNRAKRLIREAYRSVEPELPIGVDIVVVARGVLPAQTAAELTERFRRKGVPHCHDVSSGKTPCTTNPPHQKRSGRQK